MIDLGDDAYLSWTVTDSTGALQDSTISVVITLPDETVTSPVTPTRDSLGKYHYSYPTTQYGRHYARATGTSVKFAHTEVFDVEPATDYGLVSVDDVKAQLRMTSTTQDDDLRGYILSVTELIEKTIGICAPRAFSQRCEGDWALAVTNVPVLSLTSLTPVYGWDPALSVSDVIIDLDTGVITRTNGWQFWGPYTVATRAGRHVIPPSARTACSLVVQYLWTSRRGPQQPGSPSEVDLVTPPGWPYPIPARAAGLLFTNSGLPGFA